MIRVMVVDNFSIMREGIKAVLQDVSDITIVGTAGDGREAISLTRDVKPDVILMDVHMPRMGGVKAGTHIKEANPDIKIIYLTTFSDEDLVITAMKANADGFLYKEIDANVLIQTIRNVYRNQIVISGESARILAERVQNIHSGKEVLEKKLNERNLFLTERELEIAKLLMQDKTNRYIAVHLHLSEGTVKNYISEIYTKLNMHRRSKVIVYFKDLISDFNA